MLKAYSVFAEGSRDEHAELVFAMTAKEAKALAWKRPYGEFGCEWIDLRVNRVKEADHLAYTNEPFVCCDDETLRAAGWRGEDCDSCDTCGLTDFSDGANPLWAVCPECRQCGECGHDEGCERAHRKDQK